MPRNRGKNLTLIASMRLSGMVEAMCIKGAADDQAFKVYVEHFLAVRLGEGQVVIFDKLGAHKPQKGRELIEEWGEPRYFSCPPTRPDLNPIEEAFSKIKGIVCKVRSAHS